MCAIEVTPVVSTERLILRGPVRGDAVALAHLANDFNVAAQTMAMSNPYGLDEAEACLEAGMAVDWSQSAQFVIEHRSFGLVGMAGLRPGANDRTELAVWIGRPFWNRGYATEAVRAALKWAKRDWRKNLVVAGHFTDNRAAGQVMVKAGFLYTGDVEMRPCLARGREVPTRMMVWLA
jgi:RimJ/RimL family protein N-acetyltransferase